MDNAFQIHIDSWENEGVIPARFAFGKPGNDGPFATSDNISPKVSWARPPEGTKSFALICHDPDVPSSGEDVNQEGKTVSADLPREPFYHWLLADIPATLTELPEGAGSTGIVAGGKPCEPTEIGIPGQNSYTQWFAGDADMEGVYGNYDGPCPPWNDSIRHRYYFTLYALDIETVGLSGAFTADALLQTIEGHILALSTHMGTYSMNPKVPA